MTTSFNLIYEPWIPCIRMNGERAELGLKDTLAQATELREILDNSPLVTASLHRLLLAILHRNFGPATFNDWEKLYHAGHFDTVTLDSYWGKWENRFDLFDGERPFFQSLDEDVRNAQNHPMAKLAQELASGNNDTLFDHSFNDLPRIHSYAIAARLLLAIQSYGVAGGKSKPFNFSHGPLVRGAMCLIRGTSLFHTLLFNMVLYNGIDLPIPSNDLDVPTWELEQMKNPKKKCFPNGYLDLLTMQSRRIILVTGEAGYISGVRLQQGDAIEGNSDKDSYNEPMFAYKLKDKKAGLVPLRFSEERALWRDSMALLSSAIEMKRNPEAVAQMSRAILRIQELQSEGMSLDLLGFKPDRKAAKINLWRHERMPLPLDYLANDTLVGHLEVSLETAEKVGELLKPGDPQKSIVQMLAEELLPPRSRKKEVTKFAGSFAADAHFWSELEPHFYRLYRDIPKNSDGAVGTWNAILRRVAFASLDHVLQGLDRSAKSLKAAVKARQHLSSKLKKILPREEVIMNA